MRRREFATLIAALSATPLLPPLRASAQQSAMPVVGFLSARAPSSDAHLAQAFSRGLAESGRIENQNVVVEFRWAQGQPDRIPGLLADLMRRVSVIFVGGGDAEVGVVRAAVSALPLVFAVGGDPVQQGLVASLGRPGGNATGVSVITGELWPKRLELLRELVPGATRIGLLVNPTHPSTPPTTKDVQAAAGAARLDLLVLHAITESDLDIAFSSAVAQRLDGLLVMNAPLFFTGREQLVARVARHEIPAIYDRREFVEAGGLISYGASIVDQYRQSGIYVGRVLNGVKPSDLPVLQPTIFELAINLKSAKPLGIVVPPSILLRADEVIE